MEKDKILYNLWLIYRSNPNSPWLREYDITQWSKNGNRVDICHNKMLYLFQSY